MRDATISKSALAGELQCSRARITQLAAKGLPVRSDGTLSRIHALQWLVDNTSGLGGGWWAGVRDKASIRERAAVLLAAEGTGATADPTPAVNVIPIDARLDAQREIIRRLHVVAKRLPGLLHALGAPPAGVLVAGDVWDSLVLQGLGELVETLYGIKGPPPAMTLDDAMLCATLGIEYSQGLEIEAEKLLTQIDEFLKAPEAVKLCQ